MPGDEKGARPGGAPPGDGWVRGLLGGDGYPGRGGDEEEIALGDRGQRRIRGAREPEVPGLGGVVPAEEARDAVVAERRLERVHRERAAAPGGGGDARERR